MATSSVPHFQEELEQLKARLLEMGGLAEDRVRSAVKALVDRDASLVDAVLAGDQPINQLHIEIDGRCFRMLALHQPMAVDLRAIMSAVKINTDLERVGDLAINIAEAVLRYLGHALVKELIDIPRMSDIAQAMLRDALDAYVRRDMMLAQAVLDQDDTLDALKTEVFRELLTYMLRDAQTIEPALDLILISRHLERIGDHATNIAEDVIFMVSARDVRHHASDLK
ncbi:MAG: phosphate transport system regulatory protein PhoU [Acidobacteria bacterium]|nr:MAG: phosphate transport system regulatory protein PhoU [Acidobacteriota bacterium]